MSASGRWRRTCPDTFKPGATWASRRTVATGFTQWLRLEKGASVGPVTSWRLAIEALDPGDRNVRTFFSLFYEYMSAFPHVGFFTEFTTDSTLPDVSDRVVDGVYATPPGGGVPPVGFLLFVKNGRLSMLEGYTTDDRWPNVGPDWSIARIKVPT